MTNTNKKQYTFLNIVDAVTSKGNTFKNMVIKGYVSKIQEGEANNGKKLIRATVACSGRTKIINSMFGTNIPEDNIVWINVTVWEDRAERFKHMLEAIGNPNTVSLVLVGSASVNKYTNKNGEEVEGINLSVNDWTLCGGKTGSNSNSGNKPAASTPTQAPQAPTEAANGDELGDGFDFDDFGDFDDAEIPFA